MNVFELREKLIADYSSFVKGFITIKDETIKEMVASELREGLLWPDPLIQLSPFFESGESIEELVKLGSEHVSLYALTISEGSKFAERKIEPAREAQIAAENSPSNAPQIF